MGLAAKKTKMKKDAVVLGAPTLLVPLPTAGGLLGSCLQAAFRACEKTVQGSAWTSKYIPQTAPDSHLPLGFYFSIFFFSSLRAIVLSPSSAEFAWTCKFIWKIKIVEMYRQFLKTANTSYSFLWGVERVKYSPDWGSLSKQIQSLLSTGATPLGALYEVTLGVTISFPLANTPTPFTSKPINCWNKMIWHLKNLGVRGFVPPPPPPTKYIRLTPFLPLLPASSNVSWTCCHFFPCTSLWCWCARIPVKQQDAVPQKTCPASL